MSGSMRTDLSSGGINGLNFASGYPNVDRPGNVRESSDNRMVPSGLSAAQYMSLEPFSTNELKNVRSGELRRVLGISVEESSFGSSQSRPFPPISWEELRRFRGSVEETSLQARDRAKSLQDSILKLDRFRNILSKKRQRSEIQSNNLNLFKIGSHMHQNPDLLGQRLEERTKNGIPNKRARSSMAEARATSPYSLQPEGRSTLSGRQGITVEKDKSILSDKDKNMLRACNGVPMPTDDKAHGLPLLPVGGDGWDKKMKRKRSLGTMVNRTSDGDRELKQAMQQRSGNGLSPRSSDGLGFRIGSANGITASNGIIASNKMDVTSQHSGGSSRIVPRNELANGSVSIDRRERSSGLDKERVTAKGNNKLNTCEDTQLGSQSPLTKGKGARAPRTGSSMVVNSPNFPRPSGGIDGWEQQSSSVNKVQHSAGTSNRKQPLPTGSSSPPVARWGGQRREKISRTRRTNVVSPVSNFDETQADSFVAPEIGTRLSSMESNGALFNRGIQNNCHLKLKHGNVPSPAALPESEESGAIENKSKEKGMDNSEVEDGTLHAAHRAATFVLPTKKNKAPLREEFGDGVRRQGRSGRGSIQSKASLQLRKETLESLETVRPLKSGRLISDKTESRIGRPPSKKAFDRKVSSRPLQIINSSTCESDDDQEELLAAAKAAQNASCLKNSGPFWMSMEPIFASVSSEDISLVKHQINFAEELDGSFSDMLDADCDAMAEDTSQLVPSHSSPQGCQTNLVWGDKSNETRYSVDGLQPVKPVNGKIETERWFEKTIPLSQRLLSAIISDEETEMIDGDTKLRETFEENGCFANGANSFVENEHGSEFTNFSSDCDIDMRSQTNNHGDNTLCNGFASPSTTFRSPGNFISSDELLQENGHMMHPNDTNNGILSDFEQGKSNEQEPESTALSGTYPNQCQYEHTSLDDKILMELHSIGIYPDAVPGLAEGDDDEIGNTISELKFRLCEQAKKKRGQFCKLEEVLLERKECEMRNREQLAMDELVEIAYKKLVGGRGSHGSSHKSGASKASKQLAMAFANRTLTRVRKFEETGQSCFSEPFLRDVLFSEPVHGNDAKIIDGISSEITPNMHVDLQNYQPGPQGSVAASGVSSNIIESHGSVHQIDMSQLDPYQSITSVSEQALVRNDQSSNKGKMKEVLLDDVVTGAASRAMSVVNGNLLGSTKWKKIDKDHNRDILTKNSAPKGVTGRGERKTKAKPKQKIAQLSSSGNGIGRVSETTNMLPSLQESFETVNIDSTKVTPEVEFPSSQRNAQDLTRDTEDNIFANLPLQGIGSIDELDVTDGLGGQGEDIGSWLNVDDDALQDNDLVGLEIPMDDLSELKLNF